MRVNRAVRRQLKRALKLPFTPSVEFTEQYLVKMTAERRKPVLARAFSDDGEASSKS